MKLYNCSCKELVNKIEPESIDAIITDPPYPKEFLHCYEELGELGSVALKPGGYLIAMLGQSWLPEVLSILSSHKRLRFNWVACYLLPGKQVGLLRRKVASNSWKPLVWYIKRPTAYKQGKYIRDIFTSPAPDKKHHEWGQSLEGMTDIISRFCQEGSTICDPFLGAGTTALAVKELGMDFIGCDIEKQNVKITRERLKGAR